MTSRSSALASIIVNSEIYLLRVWWPRWFPNCSQLYDCQARSPSVLDEVDTFQGEAFWVTSAIAVAVVSQAGLGGSREQPDLLVLIYLSRSCVSYELPQKDLQSPFPSCLTRR